MAQYRFVVSGDFVEFYDGSQFVIKLRNTSQDVDWYYDNTPGMWFEINGYKYKVESASEIEIDGDVLSVVSDFDAAIEDIFPNLAGGSGSPTEPQNLDEVLAEGNTLITDITYANLLTAISGSTLKKGVTYKITNRGDRGIFLKAISANELSRTGVRKMLCPAFYGTGANGGNTWIGVWNATKNPNIGDLTIWGGLVWESVTGNIGTADDDITLDAVNWVLVPKASFSNGEYTEMQFCVCFDISNDWIEKQWDSKGNVFGVDYLSEQAEFGFGFNPCDVSDWNYGNNSDDYILSLNQTMGVWNNSCRSIYLNKCPFGIYNNSTDGNIKENLNNGGIYSNSNTSDITKNTNNGDINSNSNDGNISNNNNGGAIYSNSNDGSIASNFNPGIIHTNSNVGGISINNNTGSIFENSNAGIINKNNNAGDIAQNSNEGAIDLNSNAGDVEVNSNVGNISNNNNNGHIVNCESGVDTCNIHHNTNNADITGTFDADVTDPGNPENAATFSAISASTQGRLIKVAADETNNGDKSLYLHDGTNKIFIQTIE